MWEIIKLIAAFYGMLVILFLILLGINMAFHAFDRWCMQKAGEQ